MANEFLRELTDLVLKYMPTIAMALVNGIVPFILDKIAQLEKWDPMKELETKLLRLVFLKLLSLAALVYSLYQGQSFSQLGYSQ